MDCIFCKIIDGSINALTIYEDDKVKVFLDANPVTNGHMLIVPKTHYTDINDMPDELLIYEQQIARKMFKLLKEKLNVDGLTLTQNNEYGQAIKHYHLHLIPRYNKDNIDFVHEDIRDSIEKIYEKISR